MAAQLRVVFLLEGELRIASKLLQQAAALQHDADQDKFTAAVFDALDACSAALFHLADAGEDCAVVLSATDLLQRKAAATPPAQGKAQP